MRWEDFFYSAFAKENENRTFFEIEEWWCFFPILLRVKKNRLGGVNQCEIIPNEQLNDS